MLQRITRLLPRWRAAGPRDRDQPREYCFLCRNESKRKKSMNPVRILEARSTLLDFLYNFSAPDDALIV